MAKSLAQKQEKRPPVKKRTSIGTYGRPLNKSAKRSWKVYRGQGRP